MIKGFKLLGLRYSPGYGDMRGALYEVSLRRDRDGNWTLTCRDREHHGVPVTVTVYAVDPEAAARFEEYLAGSPFPSLAKRPESDLFATDYSPWSWEIDYERRSLCGIRREYCGFDEYKKYSRRDHDAIRELQERLTALRGNKISETAEE